MTTTMIVATIVASSLVSIVVSIEEKLMKFKQLNEIGRIKRK